MIFSLFTALVITVVALIFLWAAVAPLESLGWWAGWYGESNLPDTRGAIPPVTAKVPVNPSDHFIVYLSGVGAIDHDSIPQEEVEWLEILKARIPQSEVVTDIFPYSVNNTGLGVKRTLSRLWRTLEKRRVRNPDDLFAFLVNIRNMFQVAVSADTRYGPIYNLGVANEIIKALRAHGYPMRSGKPITLLGYSGGAQVSLGVSTFLKPILKAPIRVVSIGGVMSDDLGIRFVDRLFHLWGAKDPYHKLVGWLFPGRWGWFANSAWNRARKSGRIEYIDMGAMHHRGETNYFSFVTKTPEGKPHAIATIDTIGGLLVREKVIDRAKWLAATADADAAAQSAKTL